MPPLFYEPFSGRDFTRSLFAAADAEQRAKRHEQRHQRRGR